MCGFKLARLDRIADTARLNSFDQVFPMLVPVILSGGAGTRLWPVSRQAYPKPFMPLPDGDTLLGKTLKRALSVANPGAIYTVTNRDHFFLTKDAYSGLIAPERAHFVLEPMGKNTAPALLLAALCAAQEYGPSTILLALPADHLIRDLDGFKAAVQRAQSLAERKYLVTFGVLPTHPETGYGYIETGDVIDNAGNLIAQFVEKPDLETAQHYLESGKFVWNSGMFCFRVDALLETALECAPELLAQCEAALASAQRNNESVQFKPEEFSAITDISFDYAIMEKATRRAVVKASFDWNDIGSWKSLSQLSETDAAGNAVRGPAIVVESERCFVQSNGRMIGVVGVSDLVVVDTGDAVLVAHREKAQGVKQVVDTLRERAHAAAILHQTVLRPWGSYTVLEDGMDCKVKRLVVNPGQVLSLQMHHRRSEHWTVVQGTAKVTVGDKTVLLETNQSVEIPVLTKHRLENTTDKPISLIEVQCGEYFGEDDIVRFEDRYGRV
jgi:mannose-1-phosphate guanylyltransferase / mannose-6-phosphate isomerase